MGTSELFEKPNKLWLGVTCDGLVSHPERVEILNVRQLAPWTVSPGQLAPDLQTTSEPEYDNTYVTLDKMCFYAHKVILSNTMQNTSLSARVAFCEEISITRQIQSCKHTVYTLKLYHRAK